MHELRVLAEGYAPLTRDLEVQAGITSALALELVPAEIAGPVRGTIRSESGALSEQLLVFLLDAEGQVHGVAPPTWKPEGEGGLLARFSFDEAPPGELRLDVVSLESAVTARVEPAPILAPEEGVVVTVLDGGETEDWHVAALDEVTGAELESFDLEVVLDEGAARVYRAGRDPKSGARTWTLLAGGMRWQRSEGPAPLRRLRQGTDVRWTLRADGREPRSGGREETTLEADGSRRLVARLAEFRASAQNPGNADPGGDL